MPVSKLEADPFPNRCYDCCVSWCFLTTAPLVGMLMLGNLFRESGVVKQLSETASNALMYIVRYPAWYIRRRIPQARKHFLKADNIQDRRYLAWYAFAFGTAGRRMLW